MYPSQLFGTLCIDNKSSDCVTMKLKDTLAFPERLSLNFHRNSITNIFHKNKIEYLNSILWYISGSWYKQK